MSENESKSLTVRECLVPTVNEPAPSKPCAHEAERESA